MINAMRTAKKTRAGLLVAVCVSSVLIVALFIRLRSARADLDYRVTLSECAYYTLRYLESNDSVVYHLDGNRNWRMDVSKWLWRTQPSNGDSKRSQTFYYNYFSDSRPTPLIKDHPDAIVYAIIYEDGTLRCNRPRGIPIMVAIPSRPTPVFSTVDLTIQEFESLKADGIRMWVVDSYQTAWKVGEKYKQPGQDQ